MIEKSSSGLIGLCGFHRFNAFQENEIGFRFLRSCWGVGYASEACFACVEYGFDTLEMQEIIGLTHVENLASQRVFEKCGFKTMGLEYSAEAGGEVQRFEIAKA